MPQALFVAREATFGLLFGAQSRGSFGKMQTVGSDEDRAARALGRDYEEARTSRMGNGLHA
jgi:hypothetical protein